MLSPHLMRLLRFQAVGLSSPHLCPLKSKATSDPWLADRLRPRLSEGDPSGEAKLWFRAQASEPAKDLLLAQVSATAPLQSAKPIDFFERESRPPDYLWKAALNQRTTLAKSREAAAWLVVFLADAGRKGHSTSS